SFTVKNIRETILFPLGEPEEYRPHRVERSRLSRGRSSPTASWNVAFATGRTSAHPRGCSTGDAVFEDRSAFSPEWHASPGSTLGKVVYAGQCGRRFFLRFSCHRWGCVRRPG